LSGLSPNAIRRRSAADQPLTADQVERLASEVAPCMAAWMLGLPFEDELTPEEAMRLITGKTAANSA
jgi:hypothetical protein